MSDGLAISRKHQYLWMASFFVAACVVTMLGVLVYQTDRMQILKSRTQELTAIGTLKTGEIADWRRERLADAIRFARGPTLIRAIERDNPADLRLMLSVNRKGGIYADALLVAADGKILGSALETPLPLPATTLRTIAQTVATRAPMLSDFYEQADGSVHIDVAATVSGATKGLCVLVLRCDATQRLHPLIQAWPGSSPSSESVLVRRDGEYVVYLSRLRHQSHKAMSLKLPLARADLTAALAVKGREGIVSGIDYRGVRVLADLRSIPESDWFMVTKMDAAELVGTVRERALTIAGMVLLGILLAAFATALGFRLRQAALYRSLYHAQRDQVTATAKYRAILYSIGDAVITTDSEGRIVQMNPVAETLTGWREADAQGQPLEVVFRIISETTRGEVDSPVRRVLSDGKVTALANHTLLLARDGKEYPIADSAAPVIDDRHAVAGVVLVFKDQTAERAAEKALLASEQRLKTLIDNVPGVVFRCGMDTYWTMQYLSTNCRSLTGYDAEDLIDNSRRSYYDLIHPDDRQTVWDTIAAAIQRGESYTLEYRLVTADGTVKWVWERGCAIGDPAQGPQMLEGVIHDITARRLAAEQQAELDGQIQQTQRLEALGRMAGGVAHDFNNTLTVIIGNAELIREPGTTDDEREASLTAILKAGQHAATLVKRLLGFAARQTSLPRSIDLNHAISAMTEPLEQALGPNIQLAWRPSEALWPVMIDPDQVAQVLIIFADNARDAMRGEGTVTVETANVHLDGDNGFAPAGDYVRLSFRDTGCGMDTVTQTKIFDPFYSTKPDTPDTGMGLAIVYGIVKQNRGFIRVSSQPGDGSCFALYLPRHGQPEPAPAAPATPPPVAAPPATPAGTTILLVEDEPALLSLARRLLAGMGYTVLAAQDPTEALRLARSHPDIIHLLLTDLIMPAMNGSTLWDTLARERPSMKRLFMSGFTADVIAQHGVLPEHTPFLQKPFTREQLSAKVREVLEAE
ncbi:MAG TPA: PAS domain S-box protein [Kiritimatiellia bacterium]|nr:PAS domain S-box protein [Kiritimatiellia bacterium]